MTSEDAPLSLLGREASEAVAELLTDRGIQLVTATDPVSYEAGELQLVSGRALPADVVVSLPKLRGIAIAGLPQDDDFFVAVDEGCRVAGLEDVYAAGDITTFP